MASAQYNSGIAELKKEIPEKRGGIIHHDRKENKLPLFVGARHAARRSARRQAVD
jgi:hypothetical protein